MKIIVKLTLVFLVVSLIIFILGYLFTSRSQDIVKTTIGQNTVLLARETLDKIDRNIYTYVNMTKMYTTDNELQEAVMESNSMFDNLGDIKGYIDEKEEEWGSGSSKDILKTLLNNPASREMRSIFIEGPKHEKAQRRAFGEVFATNKYGANIAQTQRTTDYYQADEEWWQRAKDEGLYVWGVEYDESMGSQAISIAKRITGTEGDFIGIIKAVIAFKEVSHIIEELYSKAKEPISGQLPRSDINIKLFSGEAKFLYSTDKSENADSISQDMYRHIFSTIGPSPYDYIVLKKEGDEKEKLISHAHSAGYLDYKGLDWVLVLTSETDEMFASVRSLRRYLMLLSIIACVIVTVLGVVVAHSISLPIMKLKDAMVSVAEGKLDTPIDIRTGDEIEELASSFKVMVFSIKDKRRQILRAKERAEASVKELGLSVGRRTIELTRAHEATLNMMEDLQEAYDNLIKTQSYLIQAEKMEAVGRMASGVAHEVKNPLGIALQGVNYLEDGIPAKTEEISDVLGLIKSNIKRADNIIRVLVDFSRAADLSLKPENVNSVLESALTLISHKARLESIEIVREMADDLPDIIIDRGKMEQVFINLFINAIHALPKGGKIFLRSYVETRTNLSYVTGKKKKEVAIEIEDTGIGIHKTNIDKVFEPFFTSKEPGKGTGLGLSVVKNIIELHKGSIDIESEEGKGTKFTIRLTA